MPDPIDLPLPGGNAPMLEDAASVTPTIPTPTEEAVPPALPVERQEGLLGEGTGQHLGDIAFEDYYPDIKLSDDDRDFLSEWFDRDLRSCLTNLRDMKWKWSQYRSVFLLEYIQKFYPDLDFGADYPSGLLCDKVLEGLDRLKKAIRNARPLFSPDTRRGGIGEMDAEMLYRAQWFMDSVFHDELEIVDLLNEGVMFDYIVDGSAILEADTVYEKIPQRTLKTYVDEEELIADGEKALDSDHYDQAMRDFQTHGIARMLVETEIVTKDGLQLIHVNKEDHLVPQGVVSDRNIRFRARRIYYTSSDLRALADAGWYDPDRVEELIEARRNSRVLNHQSKTDEKAKEELNRRENQDLVYDWQTEDEELGRTDSQPYQDVFAVYRITGKYGYVTKQDPKGRIPKYSIFDYSPEGRHILRARTYPHFEERPNWFHLKLGYAPDSYYGFGFGARLMQDDFLESNAVDLYMDGAAISVLRPMLFKHPEMGGRYPWHAGFGPAKVGYVNDMQDATLLDLRPPPDAMLRHLLPLTQNRSANRTSITSLVQGRTESSDPRSPAAKTAMLIGEANVGMDEMIEDWNTTGWEKLANFVWAAKYEHVVYLLDQQGDSADLGPLLVRDEPPVASENKLSVEELRLPLHWRSMASTGSLNPQIRMQQFLQAFQFFVPLLETMARFSPEMYKKYYLRWMRRAGEEIDLPGMHFLIPTRDEVEEMSSVDLQAAMQQLVAGIQGGQGPQSTATGGQPSAVRANRQQ